jgi:glycosyltransferase involved in cell wall biosynthesis
MKNRKIIASLIIPVLNEEKFILNCLNSIISKTKNINEIEIIVIDGGSNDQTIDLVKKMMVKYNFIKLLYNKKKLAPCALNIGIRESLGEYIIRLDAHAEYQDNYVQNSINALKNSNNDVENVGGTIETKNISSSFFSKAISLCLGHPFGVGNSKFRIGDFENPIFVETVPFGCFRRELFDEIGMFNEDEAYNEDLEFNKRILDAGKKILLDPNIKSIYFSRPNIKSLILQQFNNGRVVTHIFRGKDNFHKIRHFIPFFFVGYLIFSFFSFLYIINKPILGESLDILIFSPLFAYLLLNAIFSFLIAKRNKKMSLFLKIFSCFVILHISYGFGSLYGLVRIKIR